MGLAGTLGGVLAELPGFLLGAGSTGLIMPIILSETRVNVPPMPSQIEEDPESYDTYTKTYQAETKKLRRKKIFTGQIVTGVVSLGVVLVSALLLISADMSY
jgi:hypothetical protein